MPSTKSLQNFAKTSLQKSPICYSFIINRGNKSVEKPLLGKTSSRRFVLRASWHVCEPNDWWTTHSVYKTWTISCNSMNKTTELVFCWRNLCNDWGLVIIHCQPFTSLCNHSVRTVSHKSLLHKPSSSFRTSITNQNNPKSILTFLCEGRMRPCDFALSLPYWPATGYSCQNVFLSSVLALVIGGGCALIQAPLRSSL